MKRKRQLFFKKLVSFTNLLLLLYLRIIEEGKKSLILLNIPKISVFLPIFNRAKYLYRSINSITCQTLKNIEIIAVNDGSTDNSLKILKKLSKKDLRIKIINNDRNHGTFYSRAKGIINSRGQYLMNLDPDDKLNSCFDLKILYNKAKSSNSDYLLYLIKRVPRYKSESEAFNIMNKFQLKNEDFLITNKLIKREILLKAYNYLYKDIYKYKWIYHDDNIWNVLTRLYGKVSKIVNKYMYIYKRNNDSANIKKDFSIEMKDRIYRLKTLIKIIKNSHINNSYLYYEDYYNYYMNIYMTYNNSILKLNEIRKMLINISLNFLNIFNNRKDIINRINYIMNSISHNKIIIFFSSNGQNIIDNLTYISLIKYVQKYTERKIISIDINNNSQVQIILNYINSNDILFSFGNLIFLPEFTNIIKQFKKNKIILLYNNIDNFIINNISYNNSSNLFMYSLKRDSNGIINKKLYSFPNTIITLANYFNDIRNLKKNNNNLTLFFDNCTQKEIEAMGRIFNEKIFENQNIFNLKNITNLEYIIDIIKESKIILTDNLTIMELSALSFTSCILYGNITDNKKMKLVLNLNYIKYINNINSLEEQLINLENKSNEYKNNTLINYNYLKSELII